MQHFPNRDHRNILILLVVAGLLVAVLPRFIAHNAPVVKPAVRANAEPAARTPVVPLEPLARVNNPPPPIWQTGGLKTFVRQDEPEAAAQGSSGNGSSMTFAEGSEGDPAERERWFTEQRVLPKKSIPLDTYQQAVSAELSGQNAPHVGLQDAAQWTNLGPAPVKDITYSFTSNQNASGRALTIAVHPNDPNQILLGTAQGGIWRSTDAGASFHSVSELNLPSLAIDVIRFAPSNPQIVYAGTGEPGGSTGIFGMGVLKSTDGGETWQPLPRSGQGWDFNYAYASGLQVNPSNPNTVYLTTAVVKAAVDYMLGPTKPTTGIYKSIDGGATWQLLKEATVHAYLGHDNRGFMDLQLINSNLLYATEYAGGIYKSTDAGANWTLLTPVSGAGAGRFPAAVNDFEYFQQPKFYLLNRLPMTTLQNGDTFPEFTRIQLGISKANPNIIYAGYAVNLLVLDANNNGQYDQNDVIAQAGLIFKSTDGGQTWQWLGDWPRTGAPNFCKDQCLYDMVVYVNPGNANDVVIGGSANYNALWPDPLANPTRLLELPWRGMIYRSPDGGQTWNDLTPQCTGISSTSAGKDQGTGLDIYPCAGSDATLVTHPDEHAAVLDSLGRLYVGNDGGFYRLSNGTIPPPPPTPTVGVGPTATPIPPGVGANVFFPFTSRGGHAAPAGAVLPAYSGAQAAAGHWENLNNGLSTMQFYYFDGHPTDPNIMLGGLQDNSDAYYNGQFWDGWGYGDGTLGLFDPNDPQHLYIGTQLNVHRHDTGGNKVLDAAHGWHVGIFNASKVNQGERVAFVPVFTIDPVQSTTVYGASNIGVYVSNDRGDTWQALGTRKLDPQTEGSITALSVAPKDHNQVYVGTSSGLTLRFDATTGNATVLGALPPRYVTTIKGSPGDAAGVYATLSGYNSNTPGTPGKVFRSGDQGQTWTDISGNLPDVPISALALDPGNSNRLWVGSDIGVFITTDGGTNWASYRNNMPVVVITDLKYNATTGFLMAATHGRGAWRIPASSTPPPGPTSTTKPGNPTPTSTTKPGNPTPTIAPPTPTTGTAGNLLQDPGFEKGVGTGTVWDTIGFAYAASDEVHSGKLSAHLGGLDGSDDGVGQSITIPSNATGITVGFWAHLLTSEKVEGSDKLCVYLGNMYQSQGIGNCYDFARVGSQPWQQYTISFSAAQVQAFRGQTVEWVAEVTTDPISNPSEAYIDDASLTVPTGSASGPAGQAGSSAEAVEVRHPAGKTAPKP